MSVFVQSCSSTTVPPAPCRQGRGRSEIVIAVYDRGQGIPSIQSVGHVASAAIFPAVATRDTRFTTSSRAALSGDCLVSSADCCASRGSISVKILHEPTPLISICPCNAWFDYMSAGAYLVAEPLIAAFAAAKAYFVQVWYAESSMVSLLPVQVVSIIGREMSW